MRIDGWGRPFLKMDSPSVRNGAPEITKFSPERLEFSLRAPLQNSGGSWPSCLNVGSSWRVNEKALPELTERAFH